MFIRYKDITEEVLIDVRTREEFNEWSIADYNIPIINELDRKRLKLFYPSAFFIILYGLIKNKEDIKKELLVATENKTKKAVISCSRGRLRSPLVYFYARGLGIKCKVLLGGIRPLRNIKEH